MDDFIARIERMSELFSCFGGGFAAAETGKSE
jgi:hypothetical protein